MFFLRGKIEIYPEKRYGPWISKTVNGTTKYYYDGNELILEKSGAAVISHIHGPRIDEIISDSRGYCYHTDGLGSVVNLTDSSGNKANSYTYMAFGKMRNQSGTVSNSWLFTGRQYDSESGLYYLRNRYYDPKTGRFITRDPIGIAGGINLYRYCGNSPVNAVDPWGLWKISYNAGAHVPVSAGTAVGVNVSSELLNPFSPSGKLEGKGVSAEMVLGEIFDVGASTGISDISGTNGEKAGATVALNLPGMGKYGGLQVTLRNDITWTKPSTWIPDGIQIGLCIGISLPVTVTVGINPGETKKSR